MAAPSLPVVPVPPVEFNLDCSLCLCVFKEPVIIGCGHSFCRDCITGWIRATPVYQHSFSCPMCREKHPTRAPLLPDNELAAKVLAASPFTPVPHVTAANPAPRSAITPPIIRALPPEFTFNNVNTGPYYRSLHQRSVFPAAPSPSEDFPTLDLCAPCKQLMELTGRDVDSVLKNFQSYCTNCLIVLQKHALTRLELKHPGQFQSGQLTSQLSSPSPSRATPSTMDRCALDGFKREWHPVVIFMDDVDEVLSNNSEQEEEDWLDAYLMEVASIQEKRNQEAASEGGEQVSANRPKHGHKRKRHGKHKSNKKIGKKSEP